MLCTKNYDFLHSMMGRVKFKFTPPHSNPKYNPLSVNNVIVWDLEMGDWRTVYCNSIKIINIFPPKVFENLVLTGKFSFKDFYDPNILNSLTNE